MNNWNISGRDAPRRSRRRSGRAAGHGRTTRVPRGQPGGELRGAGGERPAGVRVLPQLRGDGGEPAGDCTRWGPTRSGWRTSTRWATGRDGGERIRVERRLPGVPPDWRSPGTTRTGRRWRYASRNGTLNVDENHYGTPALGAEHGRGVLLGLPRPARGCAAPDGPADGDGRCRTGRTERRRALGR